MKNSSYFKIASTLLALSVFAGCASLPVQQGEYDDVYFTSADRAQPRKVVIDTEGKGALGEDVVTLQKSSVNNVESDLISKYNNGEPQEVVYFEEIDPRVSRASELNYDDFVWDYNNELLKNYDLPLDWDDMTASSFNAIIRDDWSFRNAWYDQYYRGNMQAMETYVQNEGLSSRNRRNLNVSVGLGFGFSSFYSPYNIGFSAWNDPFFFGSWPDVRSWSYLSYNNWAWRNSFYPFYGMSYMDPFYYDPWYGSGWAYRYTSPWRYRRNPWYWGGNNTTIIVAGNDYNYGNGRNYTRGGRVPSTSVTSVRSDAANGTGRTRSSAALSNPSTRSTISSGRVSNTSVRSSSTAGTRSSRSTSSVDQALARSRNRVSTDATRISSSRRSSNSSGYSISSLRRSSSTRNSGLTYNTSSRTRASIPSYTRSSTTSRSSGVSFSRNTSSRASTPTFGRSSRSSSSSRTATFGRTSSYGSRSSSSGTYNRSSSSSSSRSSSGSVRSSSSSGSSRSSSSSGSRSSSGSSRSSSSSSRSGRGN